MNVFLNKMNLIGLLPVVEIPDVENAVPLAQAVADGGLPAIEITFRNAFAAESIRRIKESGLDVLLGAGTVLTVEQADIAMANGAQFLVAPGFNKALIEHVLGKGGTIIPGCATPSEIESAMELGLDTVKVFPAECLGGAKYIKSLAGPYKSMRFVPTGGINADNLSDYLTLGNVVACGGSWLTPASLIQAGDYAAITRLCRDVVASMLGYEMRHIGINTQGPDEAGVVAERFASVFGIPISKEGKGSIFVGSYAEIMKKMFLGSNGHIAMATNCIHRAVFQLERSGVKLNHDTTAYSPAGNRIAVYLEEEIGGFAVHLLQK